MAGGLVSERRQEALGSERSGRSPIQSARAFVLAFALLIGVGLSAAALAQQPGEALPDFALTDLAGEPVTRADVVGKPLLLNFWATWCPPCREELPLFQQAADEAQGLRVFLINAGESREQAERYFADVGLDLPSAVNPGTGRPENTEDTLAVAQRFRVRGMPTTFFVDADGTIRSVYVGEITPGVLAERLAQIGVEWTP